MGRIIACLGGLLLLAVPATAKAQAAQGADPTIWQGSGATGPILHRASSVSLPAEIEGFARFRVGAVAADDVAANYRTGDGEGETSATVYLFRPGQLAEHRLRGSLAAIGLRSPDAFVWSAGPFEVAAPQRLHGYKGTFKTGIGPGTLMDYLYFFELGTWTVKVRATVSGISEIEQEARIDAFVRALPWDQILAANGTCSGGACTTPPFERIENHIMQTTLAPMLFSRMRFDERAEAALPVAARAEIPLMGTADIRRSEQDPLRYVTTVPRLATYRLVRLPDPANRLLSEAFGMLTVDRPVYGLVIRMGEDDLVPRLFHGEPTPEAFGAVVGDLVLNEMPGPMVSVADFARSMPE